MAAIIDKEKCTGCGSCVEICPVEAITLENDLAVVNEETCIDCASCVDECPASAITMDE